MTERSVEKSKVVSLEEYRKKKEKRKTPAEVIPLFTGFLRRIR
jgi:hypothetical protein